MRNYTKLTGPEIQAAIEENQPRLALSDKEKTRWHKKCLVMAGFRDVEEIPPLKFGHQSNMDDWLIIEKIQDVSLTTSIPYNWDKSKF